MFYPSANQIIDTSFENVVNIEEGFLSNLELMNSTSYHCMDSFAVGESSYKFIRRVRVNQEPLPKGWLCYINELANYRGYGITEQEALKDLKVNLHADFQQLSKKRPFEMSEEEKERWMEMTNIIDLLDYKTTTPVVVREIGCVSYHKVSRPVRIKWLSGRNYSIEPDKVPGELMSCRPGQWIEAVVKRNPLTHKEIEIDSFSRISFRIPTDSEIKKFWGSLPEAEPDSTDLTW